MPLTNDDIATQMRESAEQEKRAKEHVIRNYWVDAADTSPQAMAKVIELSKATGISPQYLQGDPAAVRRYDAMRSVDFAGLVNDNPKTADFLLDPVNVSVARDEVDNLTLIERMTRNVWNPYLDSFKDAYEAEWLDKPGAFARGQLAATGGAMTAIPGVSRGFRILGSAAQGVAGVAGLAAASAEVNPLNVAMRPIAKALGIENPAETYARRATMLAKWSAERQDVIRNYDPNMGVVERGVYGGLESAAQMLMLIPLSLRAAGFAGGVATARAAAAGTELAPTALNLAQTLGFVQPLGAVVGGQVYAKDRSRGVDVPVAAAHAFADYLVNTTTEMFGAGKLLNVTEGLTKDLAKGFLKSQPWEHLGEQLATLGETVTEWLAVERGKGKTIEQVVDSMPEKMLETFIATLTAGAAHTAVGAAVDYTSGKPVAAKAEGMSEIMRVLNSSEMAKAAPSMMQKFLQQTTGDKTILIDPTILRDVFEQAGIDLNTALPSAAAQMAGDLTSVGVELTASELALGLKGTGLEDQLIPHMRFDPDEPTLAETHALRDAERLAETAKAILAEQKDNAEFTKAADEITQWARATVGEISPYGKIKNDAYASILAAKYITAARDFGVTPTQLRDGWTDKNGVRQEGIRLTPMYEPAAVSYAVGTGAAAGVAEPTGGRRRETQSQNLDLFADTGRVDAGQPSQPTQPELPRDVPPGAELPRGTFATRTEVVEEGQRKLGAANVKTVEDAARALAYLGRGAVERFDALVTDKDGTPLAVIGTFKGGIAETSVFPATLIGEAFRVPGAANIWFAHNHPSGRAELSKADRSMLRALENAFEGSAIKPHGLFAIASSKNWVHSDELTDTTGALDDLQPGAVSVPTMDRIIVQTGKLGPGFSSPKDAKTAARDLSGGESGLLLLDVQNQPIAFVPITAEAALPLRGTGGMDAIYKALSISNAGAAIIVNQNDTYDLNQIRNLAGLLTSVDTRVLDVIEIREAGTAALSESGYDFSTRTVFEQAGAYTADTIDVDGITRPTTNSTGRPIAQTEEGLRNFWRWFGDSKVVDADGRPLVVYHGTAADFAEFSDEFVGTSIGRDNGIDYGKGFFFSTDQSEAEFASEEAPGDTPRVISAYIATQEPYIVEINNDEPIGGRNRTSEPSVFFDNRSDEIMSAADEGGYDTAIVRNIDTGKATVIAFDPTQIKSATGNRGTFDPADANILRQESVPRFVSQLATAIEQMPAKVDGTSAANVKAWLLSNADKLKVKKDEIQWSGVTDWLDTLGKQKVSKEQVAEYLKAGGVKIEEVVLRGAKFDRQAREEMEAIGEIPRRERTPEQQARFEELQAVADDETSRHQTKFGSYRLPGGEDYRELLLTLPEKAKEETWAWFDPESQESAQGFATQQEAYDARPSISAIVARVETKTSPQNFRSSHWDQPNVLAHMRVDTVTGADGKRYLRVIEIQSDWGQKGKKEGFITPDSPVYAVFAKPGAFLRSFDNKAEAEKFAESVDGVMREEKREAGPLTSIPFAPFVTDTKAWTSLVIKRALMMAVQEGHDGIVFATGQQNADLYDLSKQVDYIRAIKNSDGTYWVMAVQESESGNGTGSVLIDRDKLSESQLEETVGKEIAKKIAEQEVRKEEEYRGTDLKVGGEGMRAFYDQIVPSVTKDVLKKLGAGDVGFGKVPMILLGRNVDISGMRTGASRVEQPGFQIPSTLRDKVREGVPLFQGPTRGEFSPTTMSMRMLADADFSTFLHEVGHFFLAMDMELAARPNAPQRIVDNVNAVLAEFGLDRAAWDALTFEEQRPYHERFARAAEQYFFTGQAPTLELQSVFDRFASWLKEVYKSVEAFILGEGKDAKLNPELKAVMDRMLASDAEIEAANAQRGYVALFKTLAESGMTPSAFAEYQRLNDFQKADADAMLRTRSLRDMKWLQNRRNAFIAGWQKDAKEKRNEMRWEARRQVWSMPVYQAWQFLRGKEYEELPDGTRVEVIPPKKKKAGPKVVDPSQDTLLQAIAKYGGLNRENAKEHLGVHADEFKHPSGVFGKTLFPAKGGLTAERMIEFLEVDGYVDPSDGVTDAMRDLEEKLSRAFAGEDVYSSSVDYDAVFGRTSPEELKTRPGGRLDTAAVASYGSDVLETLKKRRMLREGALHPDDVAQTFGFDSGADLVAALAAAEPPNKVIEAKTDELMLEAYGDLNSPETINRAADEAIHNQFRARAIATELAALDARVGSPAVILKAAKEYARQLIGTKTSRTLKPATFLAAEARAGKAALEMLRKGKRDEAADEKRKEVINNAAVREAYEAEKEIKATLDRLRKIAGYNDKDSAVATRDHATVSALRVIIGMYGIGERRAERAGDYLDLVAEYDPVTAARMKDLIDTAERMIPPVAPTTKTGKAWQNITVADMRELRSMVEDIWRLAKKNRQIEMGGIKVEEDQAKAMLLDSLDGLGPEVMPGTESAVTESDVRASGVEEFKRRMQRMEYFGHILDKGTFGIWSKLFAKVKDAEASFNEARKSYNARYLALLEAARPLFKVGEIYSPELGYTFGRDAMSGGVAMTELLHAIGHTGNSSNKRKMLLGRRNKAGEPWAVLREDGTLDSSKWDAFIKRLIDEGVLTQAHFDFVQGIWNLMEEMKPAAQEAHRYVHGKFFHEITAEPFDTPWGRYAGGYLPAIVDPRIVKDNERERMAQENEDMLTAFPSVPAGFTKERVESYHRQLHLDLRIVGEHMNQVLRFAHMAPAVRDVRRLLTDKKVHAALERARPGAVAHLITPWLNRAARQTTTTQSLGWEGKRFWTTARANMGMSIMMGNIANAVQQLTGLSSALARVGGSHLRSAAVMGVTSPNQTRDYAASKSAYMRDRLETEALAQHDNIVQILINPTVYQSARDWTMRHAYFLQQRFDAVLSPIVWTAAYHEAYAKNPQISEYEAVRIADSVVRTTQGASGPTDIADFEAGTPFAKMFTQFAGYANGQVQLLGAEWANNYARDVGLAQKHARAAFLVMSVFFAPAIVGELIMQLFRGGPDDEDKDGKFIDDWMAQLFGWGLVKYAAGMVPGVGQVVKSGATAFNSKPYDDRIGTAPVIAALEGAAKVPKDIVALAQGKGKPSMVIRDVANLVGLLTGLPAVPAFKPAGYWADVAAGKVKPTGVLDAIRGTITGVASPESKKR